MKDNELLKIREEYDELIKKRDRLKIIKDRMSELEKIEEVLEYMELYKEYESECRYTRHEDLEKETNEDLAYRSAKSNTVTPTTNIYFYIATCKKDEDGDLEKIRIDSADAELVIFANIESSKEYKRVKIDELKDFIDNNIVIYPTERRDCEICHQVAQEDFFATSVIEGQDKAIEKFKKYAKTGYPWKVN